MIPILYEKGETLFESNGICRLPDCGMCQVTEERNGIYECAFTYPVTGHRFADIREGRIIFCTHDETGHGQPFDIYAHSEPINGIVTFRAHHISYRLGRVILSPFEADNCPAAMAGMETHTYNANPFTFWTDKMSTGSFKVTVPASVKETLGGKAGSVLDAFGKGEYEWDRFTVRLYQNRGRDTGVTIRYGVNMTDYTRDMNYWEAYSGAVPFWSNPETGEVVTPGVVYADGYDASTAEIIAMDLSEQWEEAPTAAQVKARAEYRMRHNESWLPTDNIKVSFAQLWQTEEYGAVAPLQRVRLCDRVNVIYGPGAVRVEGVQVIRVVWDVLLDRYESMELGTARASFDQMIRDEVTAGIMQVVPTKSAMQKAIDYATELINGGLGGHLVINTDADGHPNELLIMDTADKTTAVNVWRWNLNGLGHSHNGYNGPFEDVAITMDGRISANYITTGELSANRVRGGLLSGLSIDIGDGNFTVDNSGFMTAQNAEIRSDMTSGGWLEFKDGTITGKFGDSYSESSIVLTGTYLAEQGFTTGMTLKSDVMLIEGSTSGQDTILTANLDIATITASDFNVTASNILSLSGNEMNLTASDDIFITSSAGRLFIQATDIGVYDPGTQTFQTGLNDTNFYVIEGINQDGTITSWHTVAVNHGLIMA